MGANRATRSPSAARPGPITAVVLACLLAAVAAVRADRLELHTGRVLEGKLIEKTDRLIRFRTRHAGGIMMVEVFSVDEVKRLDVDHPPAPATQPTSRPATQPAVPPTASRPATRPGPRIPTPWPGAQDTPRLPPGLEPEDDEDPAERYERGLRRALAMRKETDKLAASVRLLSVIVTSADAEQLARLSEICRDETARSLADLLAGQRMAWAEQRGYGHKFRLIGATDYEKNALLNLLGERITTARKVIAPYTEGKKLPSYERAASVRTTARLLAEQLREWMRLQGDLGRDDRAAIFKELRTCREVVMKASKSLMQGRPGGGRKKDR